MTDSVDRNTSNRTCFMVAAGLFATSAWAWIVRRRFVEHSDGALHGIVVAPVSQHLLFRNAAMWDGVSDEPRQDLSIEVNDSQFIAIGNGTDLTPPGAEVIDAAGHTLLPGLSDTHVHMMCESEPELFTRGPKLMRGLGFADARPDLPAWVRRFVEVAHRHGQNVTAHSHGDERESLHTTVEFPNHSRSDHSVARARIARK